MITSLKRTAKVTALTVAFAASGSGIALAGTTSGNNSILGGNQISLPISIPVNICGNAVALLGGSFAFCQGGASVSHESDGGAGAMTSGNDSILGGNQVRAPVSVPVNVCGNAVALLGHALAACKGGASVRRDDDDGGAGAMTSGNDSIGGGNQVRAPVSIPVNVCGNAVAVLGGAFAACKGGASVDSSGGSGSSTSGNGSIGGGNQVGVPISVPVNVCGNSVAVLGLAASHCEGGTPPPPCRCHHHRPPPPCRCHHHHHHHHHHHQGPPSRHHHHNGGSGSTVTSTPAAGGSLPTTGANFLGLLALAGSVTVAGAGSLLLTRRNPAHGLLAIARRATRAFAAAR